jgi:endonuclease YncB( thermonuclease family)
VSRTGTRTDLRWLALATLTLCVTICSTSYVPAQVRAAPAPGEDSQNATCSLQAGPTHTVVRIIDAETVLLDDDRELRLIGALAPRAPDPRPDAEPWPPERQSKTALRDLVLGRKIELAFGARRRDRYGRLLAHAFLDLGGERIWVQGRLLSGGHARAYGLPGSFACAHELLAHERAGRDARAGIWSHGTYAVRSASRAAALLRQRNTFQIVAGRVVHVAATKSNTYLNFGSDWRGDFTAGIERKILRAHPDWAKALGGLEGRRIEVRGWIEYRNGPYIRIEDPSQITVLDEAAPKPTPAPSDPMTSSGRQAAPPGQTQVRPADGQPGDLDL